MNKKLNKYFKVTIAASIVAVSLIFANIFFLLPLYGAVGDVNIDNSSLDAKVNFAATGIHVIHALTYAALVTVIASLVIGIIKDSKNKL